jgi:DNA replication protein DnaC
MPFARNRTSRSSGETMIEHLLAAEQTDRGLRSIRYQLSTARFPVHRDLAGFDFEQSKVDRRQLEPLLDLSFTDQAHNVVLVGGPGTGKTHLATALGVAGITRHGKRVRFYSTVELVNALKLEKAAQGPGDPRRVGLPAVQPGRRGLAVPPAVETL